MPLFFGLLCVAGGVSLVAQADEANNPLLRFLLQEDDETSDSDEAKDESDKPEHPESDKKEDFTMEKSGESPEAQGNKKSDLPLPPTADQKKVMRQKTRKSLRMLSLHRLMRRYIRCRRREQVLCWM